MWNNNNNMYMQQSPIGGNNIPPTNPNSSQTWDPWGVQRNNTNAMMQPNISTIVGRVVPNQNDIKANEVPMDGTPGVFPQNDGSCIYVKQWNSNGTISTYKYVREQNIENNSNGNITLIDIKSQLDDMQQMLINHKSNNFNKYNKHKEGYQNADARRSYADDVETESANSKQPKSPGNN